MIKKLDKLIIRAFVGPFIATFLISVFVLVMQAFWLWIDDLVGKGLDGITILKFIAIVAAIVVPLALPLSLLLSSIMTFGKLGESFELVAIKSAGISLMRFMRPLVIISVLLCGVDFLFCNNVIPVANLKQAALLNNIIATKPAANFVPGVFNDKIDGYVIRIGAKDKDNKTIRNIVIYQKNYGLQDNLITAKSGTMQMASDRHTMQFILQDGYSYEEDGNQGTVNTQFRRTHFQTYIKMFDMSVFDPNAGNENAYKQSPGMLSLRQLLPRTDSLARQDSVYRKRTLGALSGNFKFIRYQDSVWAKNNFKDKKTYLSSLSDSVKSLVYGRTLSQLGSVKSSLGYVADDKKNYDQMLRSYRIEINKKFTLSFACFVLFLIGAPLGSIIRKGGLGAPLIFSIVFFVLFYILNTIGERLAKEGVVSPFLGIWLSTFVLLPIGIFLTYKAMRDSQLFNNEAYSRVLKVFEKLWHLDVYLLFDYEMYFRLFRKIRSLFRKK